MSNLDVYKIRASKLALFQGVDIDNEFKPVDPEYEMKESDLQNVLKEIFSVDLRTGFPRGDIQYYLSSDGNPQVKQWLENNLLKPRSNGGTITKDVTDDMIVEMSRQPDESVSDYQARLINFYDSAQQEYQSSLDALNKSNE